MFRSVAALVFVMFAHACVAADGNRLAYLDGPLDPYYPHRAFPKLITPQWVGEDGVECVVTLAIDDMRESAKYEKFLRPILDRLKRIDGRAAVSIMTCRADPSDPQLQAWLKEGLSIECHTFDHPCPLLQDGGLAKAKETYDKCVDLMNQIPGNKPVAFRMPCCDSKNTPSPRFWAEIFNKTTEKGNFLQIDSSVFNIITNKDKDLPKEITELPDGTERFRRYLPFPNFVNTIEDYPYPYIIGGMCWEFPCVVPSDWSANHVQQPNNPDTVRDWKLALDAIVKKQGTFNLVFHPHGWIKAEQIVELIDHAVEKHGKKVKFLTFKECAERLSKNLFPASKRDGLPDSKWLLDQNGDGLIDITYYNWIEEPSFSRRDWDNNAGRWVDKPIDKADRDRDKAQGKLQRDVDGDGKVEIIEPQAIVNGVSRGFVCRRDDISIAGPKGTALLSEHSNGGGLRLIDVNGDGKLDVLFSNAERYCLYLFKDMKEGWATKVFDVVRGKEDSASPAIPPFIRSDETNNGAWFHSAALWLQNEDTWRLPDGVFKLTFADMLGKNTSPQRQQGKLTPKPAGDSKPSLALRAGVVGVAVGERSSTTAGRGLASLDSSHPGPLQSVLRRATQFVSNQFSGPHFEELEMTKPLSPEESLKAMHVRPGMKIELVAAEPLIVDPVAFDWGPDGRLWVVEMRDYPNGITWNKEGDEIGKPGGRVKVLTDTDGDGRYDKASIFLDEIPFPTGVKVWRKGILVTAAPEIFYAEDTNGDDKADERKVLYRGFGEGNQQHRVNGLRWGLDNWLYVGNGDSGGVIKSLVTEKEVNVGGRDLRIRPDTGDLEATTGNTQFGRERDDWGNWFGGNNSNPMYHYTLDDFYLRRNPNLTPPPVKKQVSVTPGASPVFPKSKTLARFNDFSQANRFTSACSSILYRDDLLGSEYYGNSFVCEPVHNLVHREIVEPQGTTFTSHRAADEQQSEFLASEDSWFRPSMCRTGPDGALWISDMYRFVIEHPKWIPAAAQKKLEIRAGDDKGRIYRIYPDGQQPRPIARLDKLDTAGLVAALDSPNGTQRDLAQQMLIWRGDNAAFAPLRELAAFSPRPQTRLQALSTLDGLSAVSDGDLMRALSDEHPAVRRHAIRLAEPRLAKSSVLEQAVLKLADDTDPHVQMQLAYALGSCSDASATIAALLVRHQADPYLTAALLTSTNKQNIAAILSELLKAGETAAKVPLVERLLAMAAAMGEDAALTTALSSILERRADGYADWQFTSLAGVLPALGRRNVKLNSLLAADDKKRLEKLLSAARQTLVDERDDSLAIAATTVLARGIDDQAQADLTLLTTCLSPRKSPALSSAAATALARTGRSEVPKLLLDGWAAHSPALRGQILDALAGREDWSLALLSAVESGQIPASQFDARRRQQFVTSRSKTVRDKAEKVLAGTVDPNRQKLVDAYVPAANAGGDKARGKLVYAKRCANCHKLEAAGYAVGPDLAALASRPADYLLTQILDPNRAVEDRYLEYVVLTTDGRQLNGMLTEETGASVTLAAQEGKQSVIARSDIEQIKSSGKSLMPEGIEKDVPPAEMADLLAYLKSSSLPPKQVPGNHPEVVQRYVLDNSIRLQATAARIYGPTLTLEEKYRNLGWWSSQEDHAAWTFEVPVGGDGDYRVSLEYSCAEAAAGNTAIVEVAGQTLSINVTSTGTWDDFRSAALGTIKLPAGQSELVVRSSGPIKNALFDLRSVRLVPTR